MLNEFQLIDKIAKMFPNLDQNDDAAFIPLLSGGYMVVTCDQFTEGIHYFPHWTEAESIGYRAVAAAISDVFASGGIPRYIFTAISIPEDSSFVLDVYKGIKKLCQDYKLELYGGNVTKSPKGFSITTTAIGFADIPVRRSNARTDDLIGITSKIGSSAVFLKNQLAGLNISKELRTAWEKPKLLKIPDPQYIHAACDISDGLAADLKHILDASGKSCIVNLEDIPLTNEAIKYIEEYPDAFNEIALSSGEEYSLILTFSPEYLDLISRETPVNIIGKITDDAPILLHFNKVVDWPKGFDHLAGAK